MISLKDYAAQRNITYEAVRKSVTRYKEELEGHIVVTDRTQYLDDEAVAFLDERRKKNPVVIIQQDKDEKIQRLRERIRRPQRAVRSRSADPRAKRITNADYSESRAFRSPAPLPAQSGRC